MGNVYTSPLHDDFTDHNGQINGVDTSPALTVSGNEITDAERAETTITPGHSYDGLTNDSSFGIWESTTNLIINGGFETNTTGWLNSNGGSITRVTTQSKFGTTCGQVTGAAVNDGVYFTVSPTTAGASYAGSIWVKGTAGRSYKLKFTGNPGGTLYAQNIFTATGSWQRVTISAPFSAIYPDVGINLVIQMNSAGADTFYIDGAQLELRRAATTLTTSGNEITDTIRGEGIGVNVVGHSYDGRSGDSSFGVWEAATNSCPNGGFETNLTGHISYQGATLTRDNTRAKFGSWSMKVVTPGVTALLGGEGTIGPGSGIGTANPGEVWVASAWVYSVAGGETIGIFLEERASAGNFINGSQTNYTLTAGWQRISTLRVLTAANVSQVAADIRTAVSAQAVTIWVDGIQYEKRRTATTLTTSGNEITDLLRAEGAGTNVVGHSYDGLTGDSSFGIWDTTTNLVTNGGFETGTAGWGTWSGGTTTLTRDTTTAKFGTASLKVVTDGATNAQGANYGGGAGPSGRIVITGGASYVFSLWAKGNVGGEAMVMQLAWYDTNGIAMSASSKNVTLTTSWARYSISVTAPGSATSAWPHLATQSATATTHWIDGVQVEQRRAATTLTTSTNEITDITRAPTTITPTGTVTTTGNEVTDVTRAATLTTASSGQMMDGRSNDSSFGIWRAATNLFRRGQCDSIADSWSTIGAGTIKALDATTPPPFSTQSVKITTDGSAAFQGGEARSNVGLAATTGTVGVSSLYFLGVNGASYQAVTYWANTDATTTAGTALTFTGTGAWQRITPPSVAVASAKTGDRLTVQFYVNGTRAESFWVAHAMLESGQAAVAPYVATSGGITATHAASGVSAPVGLLSTQGWAAFRIRHGMAAAQVASYGWLEIFRWGTTANDYIELFYDGTEYAFGRHSSTGGAGTNYVQPLYTSVAGGLSTVVVKWDASNIYCSVDGAAFVSVANSYTPSLGNIASIDIGSQKSYTPGSPQYFNGDILWSMWGMGTISNADATTLNALGNTDPTTTTLSSTTITSSSWPAATTTLNYPSFTTATQGDGSTYPDSSFGIWDGTTNLVTNGSFETNTTGWGNNDGVATLTQDTTKAFFGTTSLKITPNTKSGSGGRTSPGFSVTAGGLYVASLYVWAAPGQQIILRAYDGFFGVQPNVAGGTTGTSLTGNGQWQRMTYTWIPSRTETNYIIITPNDALGQPYWIDGVQVEQRIAPNSFTPAGNEITDATRLAAWSWTTATNTGHVDDKGWVVANYTTNPKFQSNINNWNIFGGTGTTGAVSSWNATGGVGGSGAGQISLTGGASSSYAAFIGANIANLVGLQQTAMPVTAGQVVRVRATAAITALSAGPVDVSLQVHYYDSTGTSLTTGIAVTQSSAVVGTFYTLNGTHTAPASAAYAAVRVMFGNAQAVPNGATMTAVVDNAQILLDSNDANAGASFVDGDSVSPKKFAWWGTSNASFTRMFVGDSSTGIHRGATNLFKRGQCDAVGSLTDAWISGGSGGTITVATDATMPAPYSPQSIKVTVDGTNNNQGCMASASGSYTAGTSLVGSLWFKGVSGKAYKCVLAYFQGSLERPGVALNFTATGDWQLLTPPSMTVQVGDTATAIRLYLLTTTAVADTFWLAHAMIEQNATVSAPYVPTTGGATSSIGQGKMQAPSSLMNAATGWMAFRVRMGFNSTDTANVTTIDNASGTSITLGSWQVDSNNRILLTLGQSNGLTVTRDSGGPQTTAGTTITFNKGDVITAIAAWDGSQVKLSFNGGAFFAGANTAIPNLSTATLVDIGQRTTGTGNLNSDILWAAFGNGALSAADAAALHASGNNDPAIDSIVGATPGIQATWPAISTAYNIPGITAQIPTPYVNTNGATATRNTARVQMPGSVLSNQQGWISMRVRMPYGSTAISRSSVSPWQWLARIQMASSPRDTIDIVYNSNAAGKQSGTGSFDVETFVNGNALGQAMQTVAFNAGDTLTVTAYWTGTQIAISVNGAAFTTLARSSVTGLAMPATFDIGSANGGSDLNANILWTATGTGTLTNADATTLNAFGNTDPNIDTLLSTTAAPTSVWTADGISYLTPGATLQVPTPYVHTDGGTQTRSASLVQVSPSSIGLTSSSQVWFAARVEMNTDDKHDQFIAYLTCPSGQSIYLYRTQGGPTNRIWTIQQSSVGNQGWVDNTNPSGNLHTIIGYVTPTTFGISVDGGAFLTNTRSGGTGLTPTNLYIGSDNSGTGLLNGRVLWMATGTGTLTNANATTLNSLGNTDPNIDSVLPNSAATTSVWTADNAAYLLPGATIQAATPYVHTDGAAQTRAGGRVQAPSTLLNATQGWFAARLRMGFAAGFGTTSPVVAEFGAGANPRFQIIFRGVSNDWRMRANDGPGGHNADAVVPATHAVGDMVTLVGYWNATTVALSLNGAPFVTQAVSFPVTPASSFEIGSDAGLAQINADIMWLVTGTGTLTNTDAVTLNALGNTDPDVDSTLGTSAATTAVWKANTAAYLTPGATNQIATPYVATDGSTQTRNTARVQASSSLINPTQGWVAARLRMDWSTGTLDATTNPTVFHTNTGSNDFIGLYRVGGNQWRFTRRVANVGNNADVVNTFAQGDYVTVIGAWTGTSVALSINGSPFTTAANTTIPTLPSLFDIGSGFSRLDSDVLWFAAGTGTLSNADAVTINALGNADPSFNVLPGNPTITWDAKTANYLTDRETTRHHYDLRAFHSVDQTMPFSQNDYTFWHGYQYNSLNVNDTRSLGALVGTESWDTSSGVVTVGKDAAYRYSNSIRITVADSSLTDSIYGVTTYGGTFGAVVTAFPSTFLTDDILTDFNDPNRSYYLELVLRNFPAQTATPHFDLANSFIDISSTTNFTGTTTDSFPFNASLNDVSGGGDTYLRFPLSSLKFADRTNIKGVRFRLRSNGGNSTFIAQAMRLVDDEYTWQQIDIDTKRQQLARSIPRAGGAEPSTVFGDIYFKNEQPKNMTYITQFNSGHNPTGNDNTFRQFFRKQANGDRIEIKLNARDTQSRLFINQTVGGVTTTIASTSINTNILTNETYYYLVAELQGTQVRASIYNRSGISLGSLVYTTGWQTVSLTSRGLVGYSFEPYNYDFTIQSIAPQTTEFAVMQTTSFTSRKLVRGATLFPDNSSPINVIDTLTPKSWGDATVTVDANNDVVVSRTGALNQGGVRYEPIQFIGNSSQLTLTGELWTTQSQGTYRAALLDSFDNVEWVANIPNVLSNQWNNFSLIVSPGLLPELSYLHIQQQGNYSGSFKLRNIQLGYSTIAWSVSPDNGTTWQSFMNAFGELYTGAMFSAPTTSIRIQAVATTDQGWISGYQLEPQYIY